MISENGHDKVTKLSHNIFVQGEKDKK